MDRISLLNNIYENYNESARLCNSLHGQLEYITTMKYIHQFAQSGNSILEVGAGTGRYSIALAKEGFSVTALELVHKNLEILKKDGSFLKNLTPLQGDALDLSHFHEECFDMTLVLGPMYHLFSAEDYNKAIDEAVRVTKKGGVIFFAFLSVHALLYCNFLSGNFDAGCKINFDKDFKIKHQTEQRFSGFEPEEFEKLFLNKPVKPLATVAADGILELAENRKDFKMTGHDFNLYVKYHLTSCEKRELLGSSSHLLYICRKLLKNT